MLERYSLTPGPEATAPGDWPATSGIRRTPGHATLIMFAHPHCPCSRASLSQLSHILQQSPAACNVFIAFYRPPNTSPDWIQSELYRQAISLPGSQIVNDEGGKEARHFHAMTSGSVRLYDAKGHLVFSGGITAGRGDERENEAARRLVALLRGQAIKSIQNPVFGCALLNEPLPAKTSRAAKGTDNAE